MSKALSFSEQLQQYKALIDKDIDHYSRHIVTQARETYGPSSQIVTQAYADILRRGGKRVRGILTLIGYQMCGGTDQTVALQAARAIEMMHAYILIIDDIQDRSTERRGGSSAHVALGSDDAHAGLSQALNAALLGSHGAQLVLATMDVSDEVKLKALTIMNHTMVVTTHGQTHDVANALAGEASLSEIDKTMQWKTAHYSMLNPIHLGMVLADAGCEDTNAITDFALHAGKLFQITDDLLIMESNTKTGKQPLDDIREGKQTILTAYALAHANKDDTEFLRKQLGNMSVTSKDFEQCLRILESSGAVAYAHSQAKDHYDAAIKSLRLHAARWDASAVNFLEQLILSLLQRTE